MLELSDVAQLQSCSRRSSGRRQSHISLAEAIRAGSRLTYVFNIGRSALCLDLRVHPPVEFTS